MVAALYPPCRQKGERNDRCQNWGGASLAKKVDAVALVANHLYHHVAEGLVEKRRSLREALKEKDLILSLQ